MSEAEFVTFRAHSAAAFAASIKTSEQRTVEESKAIAEKKISGLLHQGIHTPGHHLFHVYLGQKLIGHLWYADPTPEQSAAFLYDIEIYPDFQGHGFGRQALKLFETEARKGGAKKVALHVFGENVRARDLYESTGYSVLDLWMGKEIEA